MGMAVTAPGATEAPCPNGGKAAEYIDHSQKPPKRYCNTTVSAVTRTGDVNYSACPPGYGYFLNKATTTTGATSTSTSVPSCRMP